MTGEFAIAVHSLIYLNHKARTVSSEELAINVCTNSARIRKIMSKMKKANFVATKEGSSGGYIFAGVPEEIDLCSILEAVGIEAVSAAWRSGRSDAECLVSSGMGTVMDGVYSDLDNLCRQRLKSINLKDIDEKIFAGKK